MTIMTGGGGGPPLPGDSSLERGAMQGQGRLPPPRAQRCLLTIAPWRAPARPLNSRLRQVRPIVVQRLANAPNTIIRIGDFKLRQPVEHALKPPAGIRMIDVRVCPG